MKKILFLTNSDALKNLAAKNKNYEFEFVADAKNLEALLQQENSFDLLVADDDFSLPQTDLPILKFSKPIHITDLFSRVEILTQNAGKIFYTGDAVINLDARFIQQTSGLEEIKLTELETKILDFFLSRNDEEKTKGKILQEVWGYKNTDQMTDTGIVEVTLTKLRKKLKDVGAANLLNLKQN